MGIGDPLPQTSGLTAKLHVTLQVFASDGELTSILAAVKLDSWSIAGPSGRLWYSSC